jgi:hypothetical protein
MLYVGENPRSEPSVDNKRTLCVRKKCVFWNVKVARKSAQPVRCTSSRRVRATSAIMRGAHLFFCAGLSFRDKRRNCYTAPLSLQHPEQFSNRPLADFFHNN